MPKVKLPGKYRGFITDHCVDQNDNGTVQLVASCECRTMRAESGDFLPMAEPEHLTAYKPLITKDGNIAEVNTASVERAFGWNRAEGLRKLAFMDLKGREFEFVIAQKVNKDKMPMNNEDGSPVLEVCWINRPGGLRAVAPEKIEDMDKRWAALIGNAMPPAAAPAPAVEDCPF